jgi:hypothetical protein
MQRIFILLWLSWGLVGAAGAQEFSSRPVMIVAFSAGGPADIVARKAWVNVRPDAQRSAAVDERIDKSLCRHDAAARSRLSERAPTCCALTSNPKSISGCRYQESGRARPINWRGPGGFPAEPPYAYQTACKPGSVWPTTRAADVTAIPLARRLPGASSNLPERLIRTDPGLLPRRSYSVLLPVGFAMPLPSPEARCALTAPFHPCRG